MLQRQVHHIVHREGTEDGLTYANAGDGLDGPTIDRVGHRGRGSIAHTGHIQRDRELVVRAILHNGRGGSGKQAIEALDVPLPGGLVGIGAARERIRGGLHEQAARGGAHLDACQLVLEVRSQVLV